MTEAYRALDKAHVWIIRSQQQAQIDDLFEENYSGLDADPISKWARIQGETFYDHDYLFCENLHEVPLGHIFPEGDIPEENRQIIIQAIEERVTDTSVTIVVGDLEDFSRPVSLETETVKVEYIGAFDYYGEKHQSL